MDLNQHSEQRNVYFRFVFPGQNQPESLLRSISTKLSETVTMSLNLIRIFYFNNLPASCYLQIYENEATYKENLNIPMDDEEYLLESQGIESNPLIVVVIQIYRFSIKYGDLEFIIDSNSKDHSTVGDLLKSEKLSKKIGSSVGVFQLHLPNDDIVDIEMSLYNLNRKVKYILKVTNLLRPEQTARLMAIKDHLQKRFWDFTQMDRRAMLYLNDKLGKYVQEWDDAKFYYPGTSIIQTSGSGKSKTVCALSQLGVFVVYCSFMRTDASGYPERSPIADHLSSKKNTDKEKERQFVNYYRFCLEELFQFLNVYKAQHAEFEMKQAAAEFLLSRDSLMNKVAEKLQSNITISDAMLKSVFKSCMENLKPFFNCGKQLESNLRVLFVFDEARELIPKPGDSCNPFACMRRTAGYFPKSSGLFVLLLDTASRVSNMAPGAFHDPSARARSGKNKLFAPIYTIPTMDVFRRKDFQDLSLTKIFDPSFRYLFGRPLWGALMKPLEGYMDMGESVENVKELAKEKLVGGGQFYNELLENLNYMRREDAAAILSARVAIKVTNSHLASTLIANHMSWCVHITKDRYGVTSFMPSEPFIADAAADLMKHPGLLKAVLCQYSLSTFEGSIDLGENGELVAELLLLFARDRKVENGLYGPLTLEVFFQNLLNADDFQKLKVRCHEIAHLRGKENLLGNGMVSFNHFCRVNDKVSTYHLLEMFIRGIGMVCKKNQESVDLVIPVLMAPFTLNHENMSCILLQIKNGFKGRDCYYPSSALLNPTCVISNLDENHFYFSMYLDVGATKCRMDFPESLSSTDTYPKSRRITLALRGLDSLLYPVLEELAKNSTPHLNAIDEIKTYLNSETFENLDTQEDNEIQYAEFRSTKEVALNETYGLARKEETSHNDIVFLLRTLLGRTFDPSKLHSNSTERQIIASLCMPLYPDEMLCKNELDSDMVNFESV